MIAPPRPHRSSRITTPIMPTPLSLRFYPSNHFSVTSVWRIVAMKMASTTHFTHHGLGGSRRGPGGFRASSS